jgi:hypothetical protein
LLYSKEAQNKIINKLKPFLPIFIIAFSCKTSKILRPTIAELNARTYIVISLQDLMQNKEKYHGHFVETQGHFLLGSERRAIYSYMDIPIGDTIIEYRDFCGLWIVPNVNHPFSYSIPDSLQNRLVRLKGYFDTTKHGHIGACYEATLSNAFDFKIINKQ